MSASLNMFILINEAMPVGTANSLRTWVGGRLRTRLPEPAPVAVRGALRVLPGAPDGPVNGRP